MTIPFHILILLAASTTLATSSGTKEFSSKLGYTIKYPSCMTVTPDDFEDSPDNLHSLDSIAIQLGKECNDINNSFFIGVSYESTYTSQPMKNHLIEIEDQANGRKKRRALDLIAIERVLHPTGVALLTTETLGKKKLRFNMYIPCKKKLFELTFQPKYENAIDPKILQSIQKNPTFIPEPGKTILYSFRCTD